MGRGAGKLEGGGGGGTKFTPLFGGGDQKGFTLDLGKRGGGGEQKNLKVDIISFVFFF